MGTTNEENKVTRRDILKAGIATPLLSVAPSAEELAIPETEIKNCELIQHFYESEIVGFNHAMFCTLVVNERKQIEEHVTGRIMLNQPKQLFIHGSGIYARRIYE